MFISKRAESIGDAIKRDMIRHNKGIGFRKMTEEEVKEYRNVKRRKEYVNIINMRKAGIRRISKPLTSEEEKQMLEIFGNEKPDFSYIVMEV